MLYPVIMAGGSGTRFWPKSRRGRPKQLIRILGQSSMIQQTVARLQLDFPPESLRVVTNATQAPEMRKQLPQLDAGQVIAEPCGRDTSACIGLAAFILRKSDPEAMMAVLSADHVISPASEFTRCIREAAAIASRHGVLVTFGIRPWMPSELYGYIRRGAPLRDSIGPLATFRIAEFKEKPHRDQAEEFLRTGEYYWNSGNFVWRAADIIAALRKHLPELHAGLESIEPALGTSAQDEVLAREYPNLARISIDYGVMEKAPNAVVVEACFEWDDVGSWDSVARHHRADSRGNFVLARHAGLDTSDCIVVAEEDHLVATLGVRNLIVVHTLDATLVCDRRRAADVKALVELLRSKGFDAHL